MGHVAHHCGSGLSSECFHWWAAPRHRPEPIYPDHGPVAHHHPRSIRQIAGGNQADLGSPREARSRSNPPTYPIRGRWSTNDCQPHTVDGCYMPAPRWQHFTQRPVHATTPGAGPRDGRTTRVPLPCMPTTCTHWWGTGGGPPGLNSGGPDRKQGPRLLAPAQSALFPQTQ